MAISFTKFSITFRRYRLPIFLLNILTILIFLHVSKNNANARDEIEQKRNDEPDDNISTELRMLRLAFLKWRTCMREELDDQQLSLEDMDPQDPQYSYLQWMVQEANKKEKISDDDKSEKFETLWHKIGAYSEKCRSKTDMWHMQPETVPGTELKFYAPLPIDLATTFVRVGIGANVSTEKFFQTRLSKNSEFFGADPVYLVNSKIYEDIGTFFPFAVGNETGLARAVLKYSSERAAARMVNHIAIDTFFTKLIRKDVIDYLFFEGDGGEYDMMTHLAKLGSLEQAGITICQINIEYHQPKHRNDPRKEIFRKHIYQFIRDRKYTLLHAANMGNLRLFWVNTSSMECARRYLERHFSNDVDLS